MKVCKRCGLDKLLEDYATDRSSSDGLQKWCKDCWHKYHRYDIKPSERDKMTQQQAVKKLINKAKYGWSKWGRNNNGLVDEDITEEWNCQACGEMQTDELPPFMYEVSKREYIRICSVCQNKTIIDHIEPLHFDLLIIRVRKRHGLLDNLV